MKKKNPLLKNRFFLLIVVISAVILVLWLNYTNQQTTSKKQFKPDTFAANFTATKEEILQLNNRLTTVAATNPYRKRAEKVRERLLGPLDKETIITNEQIAILLSPSNTSLPLIPSGIALAKNCSEKQNQLFFPATEEENKACKKLLKTIEEKIDIGGRLMKYYSILSHVPDICVKADLGTTPYITATTLKGITARLYICTGEVGDIKFRAPEKNGKFVRTQESFSESVAENSQEYAETCVFDTPLTTSCTQN